MDRRIAAAKVRGVKFGCGEEAGYYTPDVHEMGGETCFTLKKVQVGIHIRYCVSFGILVQYM